MGLNKAVNLKLVQIVSIVSLGRELIPFLYLRAKPKVEKHNLKNSFERLNTHIIAKDFGSDEHYSFYSINLLCFSTITTFLTRSYKK